MQYICILSFVNDIANPGYYVGNMHPDVRHLVGRNYVDLLTI